MTRKIARINKMALVNFYAVIAILLYAFNVTNCDFPPENETHIVEEQFPKEKCESLLTNCSCYDYDIIYGIICNGRNDFTNFTELLASDKIFDENSTYEITLTGLNRLPARSVERLIIFRLFLDDENISEIDKDAFDGVMRLRRFHVRRSKIKTIPDFRQINDSIRSINIDNSMLTALEGQGLQDLTLLERVFFVNNSIRYIADDFFKGTENVIIFDVSHNLLTHIPPNMIDTWKNLKKFALSHNQILNMNLVFAVNHPMFIYLDFNNITDIDHILYPNMDKVESFVLASNPIEKTTETSFKGKLPNVRFVYLDHCKIRDFNESHFKDLEKLNILDMSYNLIEEIPKQTIDIGNKLELDFIGNQIKKFDGEMQYTVIRVFLDENKLQNLGRTLQFTQIIEVSVARNELQYLSTEDFRGIHATENLELQGNKIAWIDKLTFVNIRNDLHYLDLSVNRIPSLNESVKYLSQLKSLNISDNLIETFEKGEFTGLNELSEIYLQNNRIKDLSGQLQLLPQLQYLVVVHNNIETLRSEQIPRKLRYLYLADNPLKCDCRMFPFLLWLNSSDTTRTDIRMCPPSPKYEEIENINATCPEMCSCACEENGNNFFMSVDCSSKNLTVVPSFLREDFVQIRNTSPITFDFRRSLVFDQNTNPYFHVHDRVLGIDLQNNSLESLDSAHLSVDMVHLYLANNKLASLPESVLYSLKKLKRVSLSGNQWDCNCEAIGFKQWLLSKLDIVQDVNVTRCGANEQNDLEGKVIWTLTDLDLCPADIGLYVSIAFGILTLLLLCLAAKIVYTRYEMNIKVYLYSHGFTWVKERDLDYDKKFDAFLSFSNKDEEFVAKNLISVIEEKEPNVRLCIHYKDFRAGEYIQDNIIYAVQNSKRTVLILSRNFLESEWCLMEFRMAHLQALEDKVHRIIVIKVGELPKDIDPAIKVYLESTTYLTWGEKYFWNNLLYVLPTSGTRRNPNCRSKDIDLNQILQQSRIKNV